MRRVHDGDLKITFKLGNTYGKGGCVEGGILENVLKEYKRRFGWSQQNQPLELSFSPEPEQVDDPRPPESDITGVPF